MRCQFRRWFAVAFACSVLACAGAARAADDYPNHTVRWLVGYPPGGSTDICARLIGQYLSEHLGQQFAVENKPGAGNNLATELAAHAAPDGYTVFLVNPANTINASLYKNLNFNFIADMAPVAGFIQVPNVMDVNPAVPAQTVAEFIAYAKANPGKINMASSGVGTSVHLSGALFMMMTGVDLVHVPYRGASPALTDLLGGQVQVMFDNLPSSIAHIQAGRLRALAVTTATRAKALPDVPTVAETVPGYEASAFFGMAVPKGTPRDVIDKLNRTVNQALADPALQSKLAELGGTNIPGTPEDFGKLIAAETEKWAKVVKATGATAE
ncbi:MAG TPA: tripartite tricarboxylate transporter substrate binding protein [Xanthobacteraceae bacterium]|nr:tripartite tricarboxylate transporter substrate binding protein [Xanthobacteraceae bacterium]